MSESGSDTGGGSSTGGSCSRSFALVRALVFAPLVLVHTLVLVVFVCAVVVGLLVVVMAVRRARNHTTTAGATDATTPGQCDLACGEGGFVRGIYYGQCKGGSSPAVGQYRPAMTPTRVLLPHPDLPQMAVMPPGEAVKVTPLSTYG